VFEGLKFVKHIGLEAIEINVDSLTVVEALEGKKNVMGGSLIAIICCILESYLRGDWKTYFPSNQCANALACIRASIF
jgi:ribonuclease HI